MVLKKYIRILSGALMFIFFVLLFSCEQIQNINPNCSKCKSTEPSEAEIEVKLSSNYGVIRINIYEGNLEDSLLYRTLTTNAKSTTIFLPLNKSYTFAARYSSWTGNQYVAVNSVTPHVQYTEDQCDEPCYFIINNTINLRLKYTK